MASAAAKDFAAATALLRQLTAEISNKNELDKEDVEAVLRLAEKARQNFPWPDSVNAKPFDELWEDDGKPRSTYKDAIKILTKGELKTRIEEFPKKSCDGFKKDNRLYHIPRMLSCDEYAELQGGIKQRARALQLFVQDLNQPRPRNELSALKCVRSKAIPADVLRRVFARSCEPWMRNEASGKINPSVTSDSIYWSVWYGPDIIRDTEGKWRVLEDNMGNVGGFGDLDLARQVLLNKRYGFPDLEATIAHDNTDQFYRELVAHYNRMSAGPCGTGKKVVLLHYPREEVEDNEDHRFIEILRRQSASIGNEFVAVELPREGRRQPAANKPQLVVSGEDDDLQVHLVYSPTEDAASEANPIVLPAKIQGRIGKGPRWQIECKGASGDTLFHFNARFDERTIVMNANLKGEWGKEVRKPLPKGGAIQHQKVMNFFIKQTKGSFVLEFESERYSFPMRSDEAVHRVTTWGLGAAITPIAAREECREMEPPSAKKSRLEQATSVNKNLETPVTKTINAGLTYDVGMVVLIGESFDLDPQHSSTVLRSAIDVANKRIENLEKLKTAVAGAREVVGTRVNSKARAELVDMLQWEEPKMSHGIPKLLEAYYAGKVYVANGPGLQLVEDKELCPYIEKMVTAYLGEEPILRAVPTKSFAVENNLIDHVFDDSDTWRNCVVKRVDGRGGQDVWVGGKLTREEFFEAKQAVEKEPESFIVQKYIALSQVRPTHTSDEAYLVDIRGPAFICNFDTVELSGGAGVGVSPVMWGRGSRSEGDGGKVNISANGFEFAIARQPDKPEKAEKAEKPEKTEKVEKLVKAEKPFSHHGA